MSHSFPTSFTQPWKGLLKSTQESQIDDFPNYHVFNPESLVTSSNPSELLVGTGLSIFTRALLPAILNAERSVHFVTCYWANSPTLEAFKETLIQLATARRQVENLQTLKISIGFSSRGLFQKLLHTASREGHTYSPSQWPELGLPDEGLLRDARIDMSVKSLFFTPLSVMHPKYLVIDNDKAWVPSCNVSWEKWFEGCIALQGDVVSRILTFHEKVWGSGAWSAFGDGQAASSQAQIHHVQNEIPATSQETFQVTDDGQGESASRSKVFNYQQPVPTIFLPSPHHRNPRFSFFPFLSQQEPPMTPLNAALLTLFDTAQRQITVITPNVTSWPALDALLEALGRGVSVQIRTSKNMMFIEQLVTAGTWTSRCLSQFIHKYENLCQQRSQSRDLEARRSDPGHLEILLYRESSARAGRSDEPVVSHFKATMVDNEFVVLGSGNMDRASWWTSQEIGLLFHVPGFEGAALWEDVLASRTETLYRSRQD